MSKVWVRERQRAVSRVSLQFFGGLSATTLSVCYLFYKPLNLGFGEFMFV